MLGRPVNCRYIVVGRFIWLGDPDITEPTFLPRGEIERSGVVRSDGAMDIKIIRVCAKKAARNEGAEGDAVFRIDWAGWNRRSRSYRDDDGGGCQLSWGLRRAKLSSEEYRRGFACDRGREGLNEIGSGISGGRDAKQNIYVARTNCENLSEAERQSSRVPAMKPIRRLTIKRAAMKRSAELTPCAAAFSFNFLSPTTARTPWPNMPSRPARRSAKKMLVGVAGGATGILGRLERDGTALAFNWKLPRFRKVEAIKIALRAQTLRGHSPITRSATTINASRRCQN